MKQRPAANKDLFSPSSSRVAEQRHSDRWRLRLRMSLACPVLLALGLGSIGSGCSDSDSGQYQSYAELEKDTPANETASNSKTTAPIATADTPSAGDSPSGADIPSGTAEPTADLPTTAVPVTEAQPAQEPLAPSKGNAESVASAKSVGSDAASAETGDAPLPNASQPEANSPAADSTGESLAAATPANTGGPSASLDADGKPSADKPAESDPLRKIKLLVKERKFSAEGPDGALRVSYDDLDLLKVLNMEPVTVKAPALMPDWLRDLDGQRIRIRGFMYPAFLEEGLTEFVLARDNEICCFGRNPKIYDLIEVQMRPGKTTNYIQGRPFDVVGRFHIDAIPSEDGQLYALYVIDDAIVLDK